jgi:hypothetical protein
MRLFCIEVLRVFFIFFIEYILIKDLFDSWEDCTFIIRFQNIEFFIVLTYYFFSYLLLTIKELFIRLAILFFDLILLVEAVEEVTSR